MSFNMVYWSCLLVGSSSYKTKIGYNCSECQGRVEESLGERQLSTILFLENVALYVDCQWFIGCC